MIQVTLYFIQFLTSCSLSLRIQKNLHCSLWSVSSSSSPPSSYALLHCASSSSPSSKDAVLHYPWETNVGCGRSSSSPNPNRCWWCESNACNSKAFKFKLQLLILLLAFGTNIFYNLDKYILQRGQIYFTIWTNTFYNLDKYIL